MVVSQDILGDAIHQDFPIIVKALDGTKILNSRIRRFANWQTDLMYWGYFYTTDAAEAKAVVDFKKKYSIPDGTVFIANFERQWNQQERGRARRRAADFAKILIDNGFIPGQCSFVSVGLIEGFKIWAPMCYGTITETVSKKVKANKKDINAEYWPVIAGGRVVNSNNQLLIGPQDGAVIPGTKFWGGRDYDRFCAEDLSKLTDEAIFYYGNGYKGTYELGVSFEDGTEFGSLSSRRKSFIESP